MFFTISVPENESFTTQMNEKFIFKFTSFYFILDSSFEMLNILSYSCILNLELKAMERKMHFMILLNYLCIIVYIQLYTHNYNYTYNKFIIKGNGR